MKKITKAGTVTKDEKKALLLKIQRLASELGSAKKEFCRILNVMEDSDLNWLVTDTIAAGATWGGMVFGTDEYTAKRMANIKRLEKKLRL